MKLFRCQAEVDINNISRCNFGEKACDDFCKLGDHVGGKCNTEEVSNMI